VVEELRRNGCAKSSVRELLPDGGLWDELTEAVSRTQADRADEIRRTKEGAAGTAYKSYLIEYLGKKPSLDASSVFVRFSLQRPILDLANAYFGMWTLLRQFNVWHNVPTEADPKNSQLWHRDPEDRQILRMFVYMSDVGPQDGPTSYIPASHELGASKIRPEAFLENTAWRSTDEQMEKTVPRDRWVIATGERGTIWFIDTRGYHKGGHVRGKDRLLYNAMWTSAANPRPEAFTRDTDVGALPDEATAWMLRVPKAGWKAPAKRAPQEAEAVGKESVR
jgi:hypothetical protein